MVGRGRWGRRSGPQLVLWFEIIEPSGLDRMTSLNNSVKDGYRHGLRDFSKRLSHESICFTPQVLGLADEGSPTLALALGLTLAVGDFP